MIGRENNNVDGNNDDTFNNNINITMINDSNDINEIQS